MIPSVWIHGIQPEHETLEGMKEFMREIELLFNGGQKNFHFFDWSSIIQPRQDKLEKIVGKYGNFLTKKIVKAICYLGTDMWWLLQGMRDGSHSDMYRDVLEKLDGEIKLYCKDPREMILVTHSWGTWVGLQYIISHPEKQFRFVTLGCPLLYGSGAFEDWGNPEKLSNIKEWLNIWTENDPIGRPISDNPNIFWKDFVKDECVNSWTPFSINAHSSYFKSKKTKELVYNFLKQ